MVDIEDYNVLKSFDEAKSIFKYYKDTTAILSKAFENIELNFSPHLTLDDNGKITNKTQHYSILK